MIEPAPVVLGRTLEPYRMLFDVQQWRARFDDVELVLTFDPALPGRGRWHWQTETTDGGGFLKGDTADQSTAIEHAEQALRVLGAKETETHG